MASIRFDASMDDRGGWRARFEALEYWILTVLLIGSFAAGLWAFIAG
jgi:hypothetical protein